MSKCFVKDPKKRWTAEMLLNHPFIAVDLDPDDLEETDIHLKTEDVSTSPRDAHSNSPIGFLLPPIQKRSIDLSIRWMRGLRVWRLI